MADTHTSPSQSHAHTLLHAQHNTSHTLHTPARLITDIDVSTRTSHSLTTRTSATTLPQQLLHSSASLPSHAVYHTLSCHTSSQPAVSLTSSSDISNGPPVTCGHSPSPPPAMCRSVLSLFLSLCLSLLLASSTSAQSFNNTLIASTLYSFESPAVGSFSYNPSISAYQPWGWSNGLGGIAAQGSPFDPPGVTTPPQNIQVRLSHCTLCPLAPACQSVDQSSNGCHSHLCSRATSLCVSLVVRVHTDVPQRRCGYAHIDDGRCVDRLVHHRHLLRVILRRCPTGRPDRRGNTQRHPVYCDAHLWQPDAVDERQQHRRLERLHVRADGRLHSSRRLSALQLHSGQHSGSGPFHTDRRCHRQPHYCRTHCYPGCGLDQHLRVSAHRRRRLRLQHASHCHAAVDLVALPGWKSDTGQPVRPTSAVHTT